MSTDYIAGMTPFLCRRSVEIAADIGRAAMAVLDPYRLLPLANPDEMSSLGDVPMVVALRNELGQAIETLARMHEVARYWWLADRPPAFSPESTSVVEASLWCAVYMQACFNVPAVEDLAARCKLVQKLRSITAAENRVEAETLLAGLRCEIGTMTRRPPPDTEAIELFDHISFTWLELARYRANAGELVMASLPQEWTKMNQAERVEAINQGWGAQPQSQRKPEISPEQLKEFVLSRVESKILQALCGRRLTSGQLDKSVGCDHGQVQRALRKLESGGKVLKLQGRQGYISISNPPPDTAMGDRESHL